MENNNTNNVWNEIAGLIKRLTKHILRKSKENRQLNEGSWWSNKELPNGN